MLPTENSDVNIEITDRNCCTNFMTPDLTVAELLVGSFALLLIFETDDELWQS